MVEVITPSIRSLVERTKSIVSDTVATLAERASSRGLNEDDAQVLAVCVRAISALAREERELEKESKLKKLSKEELTELAKKLFTQESNLLKSLKGEDTENEQEPGTEE